MVPRSKQALAGAALLGALSAALTVPASAHAQVAPSARLCFGVAGEPGGAAIVNLTPVGAQGVGNGQLISSDATPPVASNVNYSPGSVDPNVAVASIGSDGQVCFVNAPRTSVHVIADHLGTIDGSASAPASASGAPERRMDTRRGIGGGIIGPSERRCFAVGGEPGDAVIVNLTPVGAQGVGNGQLISSDATPPVASNVNYSPGSVDPNVAITPVGSDGRVCFVNSPQTSVHLVADELGSIDQSVYSLATASGAPDRKVDTRRGFGGGIIGPSERRCFAVTGSVGDAAIVNLTPLGAQSVGNGQLISSDATPPVASNVNYSPGSVDPNVAVARIGSDGRVCFVNSRQTSVHLVADHLGTIAGSAYTPATDSGAPARKIDTRAGGGAGTPTTGASFAPGQYLVGSQLPPGRYQFDARDGCYWERQSGLTGSIDDVIANDFFPFNGRIIVDIAPSDRAFEFDGECGTLRPYQPTNARATSIVPGIHVVGDHIRPGIYVTNAEEGCYWEVVSAFGGTFDDVIANDFIADAGQQFVEILSTDVGFYTDDQCGTWQRL